MYGGGGEAASTSVSSDEESEVSEDESPEAGSAISEDDPSTISEDYPSSVSEDDPSVSEDFPSSVSEDESSSSAPPVLYTTPPQSAAAPPVTDKSQPTTYTTYTTPPDSGPRKSRGKRVLKAITKPFRAIGSAVKKLGKRLKGGKKGKPAAADLLAGAYDPPVPEAVPSKRRSSAQPLPGDAYGNYIELPQKGQAADIDFSSSEDVADPNRAAPVKYGELAKMTMSPDERHGSADFLNSLLKANTLADDMRRHGLVKEGEDLAAVQKDRKRVREGLKRVWGWTDEDIRKYYDRKKREVKGTKVHYITSEADLKKYVVRPGSTLVHDDPPRPFDTSSMLSKASGPGFAIFVMDGAGNIYAGQHKVGLFHHSSFTAGRDVAAAGELKVQGGKLVEITAKSGHYMPTPEHTRQMLRELAGAGVPLAGVRCKLWVKPPTGQPHTVLVDANDFLLNGRNAKPISVGHMMA
jgi:hypothetical protein